jgi:hypothetical protein
VFPDAASDLSAVITGPGMSGYWLESASCSHPQANTLVANFQSAENSALGAGQLAVIFHHGQPDQAFYSGSAAWEWTAAPPPVTPASGPVPGLRSQAIAYANTDFVYRYNPLDELYSMQEWLARSVSPSTNGGGDPQNDDPYVFVVPLEGTFVRPAVTVELVDEGLAGPRAASPHIYMVTLSLSVVSYGVDRDHTFKLAQRVWDAVNDRGAGRASYRPQMWAWSLAGSDANGDQRAAPRLARRMRVLQTSLAMGLLQTDDEGKWSRPLSMRVDVPRVRSQLSAPVVQWIGEAVSVRG